MFFNFFRNDWDNDSCGSASSSLKLEDIRKVRTEGTFRGWSYGPRSPRRPAALGIPYGCCDALRRGHSTWMLEEGRITAREERLTRLWLVLGGIEAEIALLVDLGDIDRRLLGLSGSRRLLKIFCFGRGGWPTSCLFLSSSLDSLSEFLAPTRLLHMGQTLRFCVSHGSMQRQ